MSIKTQKTVTRDPGIFSDSESGMSIKGILSMYFSEYWPHKICIFQRYEWSELFTAGLFFSFSVTGIWLFPVIHKLSLQIKEERRGKSPPENSPTTCLGDRSYEVMIKSRKTVGK